MANKIEFKDFLLVFNDSEKLPKNKNEYMVKLFTFYNSGKKNENERIKRNLEKLTN